MNERIVQPPAQEWTLPSAVSSSPGMTRTKLRGLTDRGARAMLRRLCVRGRPRNAQIPSDGNGHGVATSFNAFAAALKTCGASAQNTISSRPTICQPHASPPAATYCRGRGQSLARALVIAASTHRLRHESCDVQERASRSGCSSAFPTWGTNEKGAAPGQVRLPSSGSENRQPIDYQLAYASLPMKPIFSTLARLVTARTWSTSS